MKYNSKNIFFLTLYFDLLILICSLQQINKNQNSKPVYFM